MKTFKTIISLFAITLFFSCSDNNDNPDMVNEEEVITTVTVTLIPNDNSATITLKSVDLDGDGPNTPTVTVSGDLSKFTTYNGAITFENESVSPTENITTEVLEEGDEHQVFFITSNDGFSTTYSDLDADGNPIGVSFSLATNDYTGADTFTVILRHEPAKTNANVMEGDITNAGGETDVEVAFPINIVS